MIDKAAETTMNRNRSLILAAIPGSNAILSNIARGCGMSRTTISRYAFEDEIVKAAIEDEKQCRIDRLEDRLFQMTSDSDAKIPATFNAVKLALQSIGKDRGYNVEKTLEVINKDINVNIVDDDDED